ncbi:MAG TPA: FliG C-terminal domain-containing protein [Bacteroidales bacterium]|nr:FliG C-terminal domain-containing protein [Bacteroidales bacterium]
MRSVCLCFQVHQPYRLRTYRFFNIGADHHYYDDYQNRHIIRRIADKCYLPANRMMLDLIREYGAAFRVSYSISGTALMQMQEYSPEVIASFRKLADTGCVEFIAEPYAHTLASLADKEEFIRQTNQHVEAIHHLFGKRPTVFRNTELIYSDLIGETVSEMGFKTMFMEGARHILGWKSPNYVYCNSINPKLKLLLRNFRLSDDISFRFSSQTWQEYPLTADKFVGWLNHIDPKEEVVNIFIDYETIGERQWKETGIFDFFSNLPRKVFSGSNFVFKTASDLADELQTVSSIHVPNPVSWADEERDLTSWLGNELQHEAFQKLYSVRERIRGISDPALQRDWNLLQTSDHFYYMSTKWFSDGAVHKYFNPYASPYEAFINYMNVLSDFHIRIDQLLAQKVAAAPEVPEAVVRQRVRKGKIKETEATAPVKKTRGRPPKKEERSGKTGTSAKKEKEFRKFNFEDLAGFSDRKVKQLIKNVDLETVTRAMAGAEKEVRQKVEKNLGKRALKAYKEIVKQVKTIHATEIRKSRQLIEKQIRTLFK